MSNLMKSIVLGVAALLLAGSAPAAEILKLKPVFTAYVDGKGSGLRQPEGVGCNGKDHLVVADTGNGRLVQYQFVGEQLTPTATWTVPQLPYPVRVQIRSKGDILVLDGKQRKIALLSPAGEFQGYIEPTGLSTPGAVVPRSFDVDRNDNLYLLDVYSARVIVMDPAGKVQREVPFPQEYGFFSDLVVDSAGNIYLLDSVGRKVFSASKDSATISQMLRW